MNFIPVDLQLVNDGYHRSLDRTILVANREPRRATIGDHNHLANTGAKNIRSDDDILGWVLLKVVRMNNQESQRFDIDRLLGGPERTDYFSYKHLIYPECFLDFLDEFRFGCLRYIPALNPELREFPGELSQRRYCHRLKLIVSYIEIPFLIERLSPAWFAFCRITRFAAARFYGRRAVAAILADESTRWQDIVQSIVRPWYDMHRNQLPYSLSGRGPGFRGSLHRAQFSFEPDRHKSAIRHLGSLYDNSRRFRSSIACFNGADQSGGFDQT
jgi:hypothetical protein